MSQQGDVVYKGYVDDPRNTDNAWIETVAVHRHCDAFLAERLCLKSGDDAADVKWMTIDDANPEYQNLYASHKTWVDAVHAKLEAEFMAETETRADSQDPVPDVSDAADGADEAAPPAKRARSA